MRRAFAVALTLLFVPLAFGQATAVKICDAKEPARCVTFGADAGVVQYALPTTPAGIQLDQTVTRKFLNCAAAGSATQIIPDGKYLLTVFDEATTLCLGTPCDGGYGTPFPPNLAMLQSFATDDGGTMAACLSAAAGGDLYFTKTR